MNKKNIKKNNGFVLLYTMIISGMILSVALGVASIALKEAKFSTSAKATNEAFFAADTGAECALFHDRIENSSFTDGIPMFCAGNEITLAQVMNTYSFSVFGLGSSGNSCAKVILTKDLIANTTIVISKGYNNCNSSNQVERELQVTY